MKMQVGQAMTAGFFALSSLAGIGTAVRVSAAEKHKGACKKSREEGHGSSVRNTDGAFPRHTGDVSTNTCSGTRSICTGIPPRAIARGGGIAGSR